MIYVNYGNRIVKKFSSIMKSRLDKAAGHTLTLDELREITRVWAESTAFSLVEPGID